MQEATFELTEQAFNAEGNMARFRLDDTLHVRFFMHPVMDQEKSNEAGRPIFVEKEYVEICIPGDKENIVVRPVRDMDRRRFHNRYQQFKSGQTEVVEGTPLEAWPSVTRAQVEEFKFFNIRTVEQLAAVPDNIAQRFAGIQNLKQKAAAFLEAAKGNAPLEKLQAELQSRDAEMEVLRQANAELAQRLANLEKLAAESAKPKEAKNK